MPCGSSFSPLSTFSVAEENKMATLAPRTNRAKPSASREIEVPAPTAWPIVLAFGFTLMFAGLLTNVSVSALGVVLGSPVASAGSARFSLASTKTPSRSVRRTRIATTRRVVERLPIAPELLRAWLPLKTYPISAGIKGGIVGGIAMAVLACTYGLLKPGSIWYPINLLAATVYSQSLQFGTGAIKLVSFGSFFARRSPSSHRLGHWSAFSTARCFPCFRAAPSTRRSDRPGSLVGLALLDPRASQSAARRAHQLAIGSSLRKLLSALSQASSSCGNSASHPTKIYRSPIRAGIEAPEFRKESQGKDGSR